MKPMLIITGKSGSGKNYIPELFNLKYTPGNTTRDPRPSDPKELFYHKKVVFNIQPQERMCAITFFDGNFYWTYKDHFYNKTYDFLIAAPDAAISLYEDKLQEKITRPMTFIYLKASLFKRIKNMRRRKDPWPKIIKRVIHDAKAYRGYEIFVKKINGSIVEV